MTFKPTSSKTRTSGNPQLDKALKELNANKKVVDIKNLGGLSDEALSDIAVLQENVIEINADIAELKVTKQDLLVSGENIKTINGESLLGAGNIVITSSSNGYNPQGW